MARSYALCCRKNTDWAGHQINLNRISLTFCSAQTERAFVHSHSADLVERTRHQSLMVAASIVVALGNLCLRDVTHYHPETTRIRNITAFMFAFLLFLFAGVAVSTTFSKIIDRIDIVTREISMVMGMIFLCPVPCLVDPWYLGHVAGTNKEDLEIFKATDTRVLLIIVAVISASHFAVPIRWFLLVPLEIAAALTYLIFVLVVGSNEQAHVSVNLCMLVLCIVLISMGKRSVELFDRAMFHAMIGEKNLRVGAEFQLSRPSPTKQDPNGDSVTSIPDTTASGHLLSTKTKGIQHHSPSDQLEGIMELGRKEHWLIDVADVKICPDLILGRGGFAYMVVSVLRGTPVALKVHHGRKRDSIKQLCDVAHELRVLRHVRHPNIVFFIGACIDADAGRLALLFEWVHGKTLNSYLKNRTKPVSIVAKHAIFVHIARALQYLHEQSPRAIVHGDLKPANVMVQESCRVDEPAAKLLDFGLACLIDSRARALGGTLRWLAPEIIKDSRELLKPSVDIYAFGRILQFALTGQVPFEGKSNERIKASLIEPDEEPLTFPVGTPSFLQTISEQWIAQNANLRPSALFVNSVLADWSGIPETFEWEKGFRRLQQTEAIPCKAVALTCKVSDPEFSIIVRTEAWVNLFGCKASSANHFAEVFCERVDFENFRAWVLAHTSNSGIPVTSQPIVYRRVDLCAHRGVLRGCRISMITLPDQSESAPSSSLDDVSKTQSAQSETRESHIVMFGLSSIDAAVETLVDSEPEAQNRRLFITL